MATAGVRRGVKAFAFRPTETPTEPSRGGAEVGASPATSPNCQLARQRGLIASASVDAFLCDVAFWLQRAAKRLCYLMST